MFLESGGNIVVLKIGIGALALVGVFLIYVATRDGRFRYERSGLIEAAPEKIFPYLSKFSRRRPKSS